MVGILKSSVFSRQSQSAVGSRQSGSRQSAVSVGSRRRLSLLVAAVMVAAAAGQRTIGRGLVAVPGTERIRRVDERQCAPDLRADGQRHLEDAPALRAFVAHPDRAIAST